MKKFFTCIYNFFFKKEDVHFPLMYKEDQEAMEAAVDLYKIGGCTEDDLYRLWSRMLDCELAEETAKLNAMKAEWEAQDAKFWAEHEKYLLNAN